MLAFCLHPSGPRLSHLAIPLINTVLKQGSYKPLLGLWVGRINTRTEPKLIYQRWVSLHYNSPNSPLCYFASFTVFVNPPMEGSFLGLSHWAIWGFFLEMTDCAKISSLVTGGSVASNFRNDIVQCVIPMVQASVVIPSRDYHKNGVTVTSWCSNWRMSPTILHGQCIMTNTFETTVLGTVLFYFHKLYLKRDQD